MPRVTGTPRYVTLEDLRAAAHRASGPLFGVPETDDMLACGLSANDIIARQQWGGATPPGERAAWERAVRARAHWHARAERAALVYATALVECAADYDLRIHQNPDAMAWAKFFMERNPRAAEVLGGDDGDALGTMVGWFANAMMAMHDHLMGGGPINGDHAQYLLDHPETAGTPDSMLPNRTTVRWGGEFDLLGLLRTLRRLGNAGASRSIIVEDPVDDDEGKFYFDGDGADRLEFDDPDAPREEPASETAASAWWDRLTPRERKHYVEKHPRSTFAQMERDAPRLAVETHLRGSGYHQKGGSWHHARSGASVLVGRGGVHIKAPGAWKASTLPLSRPDAIKRSIRAASRVVRRKRRRSWDAF